MQQTSSAPEFLTIVPESEPVRHVGPACGCGVGDASVDMPGALGVDPAVRDRNLKRLRRIEGQVRGLQRMIQEDRYCADILTQVSSVHEALRAVGREVVRNHARHCVAAADRDGGGGAIPDEVIEMIYRSAR